MARASSHFRGCALALAGALVTVTAAPAVAADYDLKIAYETSDTHLKARTAQRFAERIGELSDDRIEVKLYPNASLVPSNQEVNAAIRGQVEAIMPFVSYYESVAPSARIFTMPMLFDSYDHVAEAWEGAPGDAVRSELSSKGLAALGYWYDTPTHLFTTEEPVTKLEDVEGMKIRTYPSATLEATIGELGAVPTVIPGNEVYLALKNGVADGALTTPAFAASLKLTEPLNHMTRLNLAFGGYIFAINKDFLESLPPELQEAVRTAAREVTEWNAEAIHEEVEAAEQEMMDAGLALHDLDEGNREKWVEAARPVLEQQDAELRDLVSTVR